MPCNYPTIIIAEAGVNHNGSLDLALKLVDAAAQCGADIIKFQTFTADQLATPDVEMAAYQKENCGVTESQYDMLKKLELPRSYYPDIQKRCEEKKVRFMTSIFDHQDASFLSSLNMPYFKIPSGEITNAPLLLEVSKTQTPIILSTGMATLGEIEQALMVIAFGYLCPHEKPSLEAFKSIWKVEEAHEVISQKVILLHCTSNYPAKMNEINLRVLDTLATCFQTRVGYSDHTLGDVVAIAAVAKGACVIEKHFTLDQNLPGPDHKASMAPQEFSEMVSKIRQIEDALGSAIKFQNASEEQTAKVVRKALIASCDIAKDQIFSEANIGIMRSGKGISPMMYWDVLGQKSDREYAKCQKIS